MRAGIGMVQRRGFRLHQWPWASSVVFDLPAQRGSAMFHGRTLPLFRHYRLVCDLKEGRIDFYVYRFLFFRRRVFSLDCDPETWRARFRELLASVAP